jgi:hypothetical protein
MHESRVQQQPYNSRGIVTNRFVKVLQCILVLKEQSIIDYIYFVVEEGGLERKIRSQVI